jgi:hypothetical protein
VECHSPKSEKSQKVPQALARGTQNIFTWVKVHTWTVVETAKWNRASRNFKKPHKPKTPLTWMAHCGYYKNGYEISCVRCRAWNRERAKSWNGLHEKKRKNCHKTKKIKESPQNEMFFLRFENICMRAFTTSYDAAALLFKLCEQRGWVDFMNERVSIVAGHTIKLSERAVWQEKQKQPLNLPSHLSP